MLGELLKGLVWGFTFGFFLGCIIGFRVGNYREIKIYPKPKLLYAII